MKRLFFTLTLLVTVVTMMAIPAKRGQWKTLRLANGTEVKAMLVGDEHLHFWQTEKGDRYVVKENGTAELADMEQMTSHAASRRGKLTQRRAPRRVTIGEQTHYTGQKRGIVILMQFQDTKFKTGNDQAMYNDILNKENYTTSPFKGSVADYFKAQSGGLFELTFDVLGPYTAKNKASYYGSNDSSGNDKHPDELIVEAVKAADSEVNYKDYDWDNDGEVDQVFVLYAGKGEADGGAANTIWPHMYYLSETYMTQTLDNVHINSYACSNEVTPSGSIEGIGCFCHEFSHCMGFPDFYDTSYSGWFGMSQWDLMDQGSYNGDGFQPAGYTAYEKWMSGWLEPIVLDKDSVTVKNLKATNEGGESYIIYNDGNKNEYYMVENRQNTGWDASLPGKGLMIIHVDFDSQIWEENNPNTKVTQSTANQYGLKTNDHQRFTIFHADNDDDAQYWNTYAGYYSKTTLKNDLFPYNNNDSLTDTSRPAATLYKKNTDGKKYMHKPITKIKQNSDGTMSFIFRENYKAPDTTQVVPVDTTVVIPVDTTEVIVIKGDTLFYESFDNCTGSGGNDGKWNGSIAQSKFKPDNDNWESLAAYAANQCARFGNGTKIGNTTTPEFPIDGEAILTFKAAAWDSNTDGPLLKIQATDNVTLSISQLTLPKGKWGEFTIKLTGEGKTKLTFSLEKRFFLDEVLVTKVAKEPNTDVNGDGTVDIADLSELLDRMIPATPGAEVDAAADINGDGVVNIADIIIILKTIVR